MYSDTFFPVWFFFLITLLLSTALIRPPKTILSSYQTVHSSLSVSFSFNFEPRSNNNSRPLCNYISRSFRARVSFQRRSYWPIVTRTSISLIIASIIFESKASGSAFCLLVHYSPVSLSSRSHDSYPRNWTNQNLRPLLLPSRQSGRSQYLDISQSVCWNLYENQYCGYFYRNTTRPECFRFLQTRTAVSTEIISQYSIT